MKPHLLSRVKNQVVLVPLSVGFCLISCSVLAQSSQEPLTLDRAVALALETNQLVKAADFGVQAAETRTRSAFSGYLPKFNFDYNLTRGDNPVYVFGALLTQGRFTGDN